MKLEILTGCSKNQVIFIKGGRTPWPSHFLSQFNTIGSQRWLELRMQSIQCGAVKAVNQLEYRHDRHSISPLGRDGIWGVFGKNKFGFMQRLSHCTVVWKFMLYWTALQWHSIVLLHHTHRRDVMAHPFEQPIGYKLWVLRRNVPFP